MAFFLHIAKNKQTRIQRKTTKQNLLLSVKLQKIFFFFFDIYIIHCKKSLSYKNIQQKALQFSKFEIKISFLCFVLVYSKYI